MFSAIANKRVSNGPDIAPDETNQIDDLRLAYNLSVLVHTQVCSNLGTNSVDIYRNRQPALVVKYGRPYAKKHGYSKAPLFFMGAIFSRATNFSEDLLSGFKRERSSTTDFANAIKKQSDELDHTIALVKRRNFFTTDSGEFHFTAAGLLGRISENNRRALMSLNA